MYAMLDYVREILARVGGADRAVLELSDRFVKACEDSGNPLDVGAFPPVFTFTGAALVRYRVENGVVDDPFQRRRNGCGERPPGWTAMSGRFLYPASMNRAYYKKGYYYCSVWCFFEGCGCVLPLV